MRKKQMFAAGLAVLTAAAMMLTGCGGKKPQQTAGKATSFTYWVALPGQIATKVSSFNDVLMYQQREKDSGIHIEFIHPAQGQEGEQFNLMIASRELPDMIEFAWPNYQGGPQKAIEDGVILPLNDYIDSHAPNFKKTVTDKSDLSPIYAREAKTDAGQYFAFPNCNIGDVRTFAGPMIRKDWLDDLGMSVPETIDEWTAALTAFKEKKGATSPLTAINEYFNVTNAFNGAFGVGQRLYLDGNTVKFGPLEAGFKEYLGLLRSWYQNGLLDKDYATNQRTIVDAKITKGNAGATVFTLGGAMGVYLKQMQSVDPNYNLVCAPYPVKNKGDVNNFYQLEGDVFGTYLAITTQCSDPATAAEWADFWYSDEGFQLLNFGVEGVTHNMVDGKPVYTEQILNNPDGLSINEALSLQCRATQAAPGFRQAPDYLEQYYEFDQQIAGFKLWAANVDGVRSTTIPGGLSALPEESEEISSLKTNIDTYVEEMCLKFVTGEESLDHYDAFVETLKSAFKIDRYIQLQQTMYDRYLKR